MNQPTVPTPQSRKNAGKDAARGFVTGRNVAHLIDALQAHNDTVQSDAAQAVAAALEGFKPGMSAFDLINEMWELYDVPARRPF